MFLSGSNIALPIDLSSSEITGLQLKAVLRTPKRLRY